MKEEKALKAGSRERVFVSSSSFMTHKGIIVTMDFDKLRKLYFLDVDPEATEGIEKEKLLFAQKHRLE